MDSRLEVRKDNEKSLRRLPNVIGTGIGKRIKNNKIVDEDVIHIFVKEKTTNLKPNEIIPKQIWSRKTDQPIRTDVIEIGHLVPKYNRDVFRPILGGVSVANANVNAIGTLSGVFRDTTDNLPVILSNNHVIANENEATLGEDIEQPSPFDAGGGGVVGTLKRFITIGEEDNHVDGGLATIDIGGDFDIAVTNIGLTRKVVTSDPPVNKLVRKSGRTSEYTFGIVVSTNVNVVVTYDFGDAEFTNQIATTCMLQPGDSGSLLFSLKNELLGLGFAGSQEFSVFNRIEDVFNELEIDNYNLNKISAFRNPIQGGFFYRSSTGGSHDPRYTVSHGAFFFLYPTSLNADDLLPLKRWRTTSYPYKYALSTFSPGGTYTDNGTLGKTATIQKADTVPLWEFIDGSNNRYYSTDEAGGGVDTDIYIPQPFPIGFVAKIDVAPFLI